MKISKFRQSFCPLLVAILVFVPRLTGALAWGENLPTETESDAVAVLAAASGIVEVQRDGEWFEAQEGDELGLEDVVRTGEDGLARLEFLDGDSTAGAQSTLLDLSAHSQVRLEEVQVTRTANATRRTGLLGLLRGAVHAITKGWGNGSLFSVRAGTTVCGIRGSIASVSYDPEDENSTVTSLDGEMYTYEAHSREAAFEKTLEASKHLAQRKHPKFARKMAVGESALWKPGQRLKVRRVSRGMLAEAREAALGARSQGPRHAKKWIGYFASVKPPANGRGRLARKRLESRFLRKASRRRANLPGSVREVRQAVERRRKLEKRRERLNERAPGMRPAAAGAIPTTARKKVPEKLPTRKRREGLEKRRRALDNRRKRLNLQRKRLRKR